MLDKLKEKIEEKAWEESNCLDEINKFVHFEDVMQAIDEYAAELKKEMEKIPYICQDYYNTSGKCNTVGSCPAICPKYKGGE
jgi:hypothetical protein